MIILRLINWTLVLLYWSEVDTCGKFFVNINIYEFVYAHKEWMIYSIRKNFSLKPYSVGYLCTKFIIAIKTLSGVSISAKVINQTVQEEKHKP